MPVEDTEATVRGQEKANRQVCLPMSDTTIQINLSAGDLVYAHETVPALIANHFSNVAERLILIDATPGQRTRIFNPTRRGTPREFAGRIAALTDLSQEWRRLGLVDRIYTLKEDDPLIDRISAKWLRGLVRETHDYGGCALMSYLAAFELTKTRFLLHYDADMLLYQAPGFDWAVAARSLMLDQPKAIAARPRISPPFADWNDVSDAPSTHEALPLQRVPGGWANGWFSTRCFLFDRVKLMQTLPVLSWRESLRLRLRRKINRGYPPAPELMLFRHLPPRGYYCINLSSHEAWLLHPHSKPLELLRILPELVEVVRNGRFPAAQKGRADIDLEAWREFLAAAGTKQ